MNDKDLVLKILDKHRDMSLTMGCDYEQNGNTFIVDGVVKLIDAERNRPLYRVERQNGKAVITHFDKILGHPATPLTLLKALNGINEKVAIWSTWGDGMFISCGVNKIQIPDVTTLTELPHTHQLWTDLLPILS